MPVDLTEQERDQIAPRIAFEDFMENVLRWFQGEHLAMIGPTGSGKTTLAIFLLALRDYVAAFATKPRDSTMSGLIRTGYKRMETWNPKLSAAKAPRRVLWPNATDLYSAGYQRQVFQHAMECIYRTGCWCVYWDELWYMIHQLKMELELRTYLQQARALKISLMVGTQRPAFVPLEIYDQSTHLFFWRDNDETNLRRISGISYLSAVAIRSLVANLEPHEFLYINTKTGQMVRSMAPRRAGR